MSLLKIVVFFFRSMQLLGSELMKLFLRINGAKIGKNVYISISAKFLCKKIVIGKDTQILENVRIKGNQFICGDSVVISANSLFSGSHSIEIGDKSYFGKNARIDLSRDVTIGKDVGFGENSIIWTHGYFPPADEGYPVSYAPVTIGDGAWVSTSIIVLPGVKIGKGVIIGAGSVVTREIEDHKVAAGNPAKVIKDVESIKRDVKFYDVMTRILDKFKTSSLVNKEVTDDFLKYDFGKFNIYVVQDKGIKIDNSNPNNIILYKGLSKEDAAAFSKYSWFNFDEKIRKRVSNKVAKELHFHFKGFGIRFLIED